MSIRTIAKLFESLRFDEVTMDTKLAEQFIQSCDIENKVQNGEYYAITIETDFNKNYCSMYKDVAKKLLDNTVLFAQLEHLTRKFRAEDIFKYDVPMIAHNFEHFSVHQRRHDDLSLTINFNSEIPLAILGYAAGARKAMFLATKDTVVVAMLFGRLCKAAGLLVEKKIVSSSMQFLDKTSYLNTRIACLEGALSEDTISGSVVVVTSKSDVDSAVEGVKHATRDPRYPWRVRRVIVQESVYEKFRTLLSNKSDGVFAFDIPRSEQKTQHILVEGYRTTKELLSLLDIYRPLYLSLWCNDISTSNEIALKASALTVWINDFGVISHKALPTFYSGIDSSRMEQLKIYRESKICSDSAKPVYKDLERLLKIRNEWVKKSVAQRKELVLGVLEKMAESEKPFWKEIKSSIVAWEQTSFYEIDGGRVKFGVQLAYGAFYAKTSFSLNEVRSFLESIITGNGILFERCDSNDSLPLIEFEKSGVPFINTQNSDFDFEDIKRAKTINGLPINYSINNAFKTITLSFGETFAN